MSNKKQSYTAASTLPVKLMARSTECVRNDFIRPVHIQICPTNKCNLSCPFCSCATREKGLELPWDVLEQALYDFANLGTNAITITGGGEPCLYPHLGEFIQLANSFGIKVGMVTNGIALNTLPAEALRLLTWCRISVSDFRDVRELLTSARLAKHTAPDVDYAFSYVVTDEYDPAKLEVVVRFANAHEFTHVRVVSDLMALDSIPPMEWVKASQAGEDLSRVIFQDRQSYSRGTKDCRISLLKPVIAADGFLYPCCGAQYAIPGTEGNFPEQMKMCHVSGVSEFYLKQKCYDGTPCTKCYYTDYNSTLAALIEDHEHEEFV